MVKILKRTASVKQQRTYEPASDERFGRLTVAGRHLMLGVYKHIGMAVSMDGRGRWMDNVFVERLWRTVKCEHLYLHDYATPRALQAGLAGYFPDYNEERIHAALDYRTPLAVYLAT